MSENGLTVKKTGLGLLAFALWAITSAVAFLEILTVREIVLRVYARFAVTSGFYTYTQDYSSGAALGQCAVGIMAIFCIGVIVAAGEYHLKHFGEPRSWRLFSWTIAAELSILILALFV